ncbi:MAG: DUF3179 domain-containing (seleno)protein, partial [Acidimicrobiia bacterium]|nr:DUF3179 domain-containing (seleno)protein [Acidimicrobiia bacterium]
GSVAVFESMVGGMALHFEVEGRHFKDRTTGTVWDFAGRGVEGPLEGSRLRPVPHLDTFWFAWSVYRPETELVTD